ncbi:aminotransferase class I/II-fold pyridoxal phosphate-dependent enzyme [Streptomyces sp. NRRL B-24484]|uniref:aminotransferase class I/II-fold pyridoxal phosphate-dependent enzyme n=1 Tax=Streptomyces sp. NRRL B-24484 TaxID=1463833 RepID=UPI0004BEC95F|nr:aminotransferase class I/II-fold pyridoxal phosphate-dependent enzyme [Streptomyces sp. NRRL B-24484]
MTESFDRSGTGSSKWARAGRGRIALGLADMDLPGPAAIGAALAERARHPAFGYTVADPDGPRLVSDWYRRRHGAEVDPDWVLCLPCGPRTAMRLLLDAAAPLVRGRTAVAAAPEWGGFAGLCAAAGLPFAAVPPGPADGPDGLPADGFAARRPGVLLVSSPHNPTGRLRTAAGIRALAGLAAAEGGLLVSDEVHGDLVHPDHGLRHPVAVAVADPAAARHTVTVGSVGKTFNTSGIPSCWLLVPDAGLRARVRDRAAALGVWEGGLLEQIVQRAALTGGAEWLDGLLRHLAAARDLALAALGPAVLARPQASYLLWLDGAVLGLPPERASEVAMTERDVELADGADFGAPRPGLLRLNYALPLPLLERALHRLTRP